MPHKTATSTVYGTVRRTLTSKRANPILLRLE